MASDTKSLKSSGGLGIESKTFNPDNLANDPTFTPQIDAAAKVSGSPKKRIAIIAAGIVIILALTAVIAYFFVLPLFSPEEPEVVVNKPTTEQEQLPPSSVEPKPSFIHKSF